MGMTKDYDINGFFRIFQILRFGLVEIVVWTECTRHCIDKAIFHGNLIDSLTIIPCALKILEQQGGGDVPIKLHHWIKVLYRVTAVQAGNIQINDLIFKALKWSNTGKFRAEHFVVQIGTILVCISERIGTNQWIVFFDEWFTLQYPACRNACIEISRRKDAAFPTLTEFLIGNTIRR